MRGSASFGSVPREDTAAFQSGLGASRLSASLFVGSTGIELHMASMVESLRLPFQKLSSSSAGDLERLDHSAQWCQCHAVQGLRSGALRLEIHTTSSRVFPSLNNYPYYFGGSLL